MRSGFTLVELSIVLVIIGLLIGGILVGQSLIDSVRIHSFASEYKQVATLFDLYKDKFRTLPGDDINGSNYFQGECDNYGLNAAACAGDGDKQLDIDEQDAVWAHLKAASFLGEDAVLFIGNANVGVNNQRGLDSNFENIFYSTRYSMASPNSSFVYEGAKVGNFILTPSEDDSAHFACSFSPSTTLAIDKKIDDGLALSGDVWGGGVGHNNTGCLNGTNINHADYDASVFADPVTYNYDVDDPTEPCCLMYFWEK